MSKASDTAATFDSRCRNEHKIPLGSAVVHLHRQSFAGLEIDSVSPGKYQILKENEAKKLLDNIPA